MGPLAGTAPCALGAPTLPPLAANSASPRQDSLEKLPRRRHAHHSHKRGPRNSHPRQILGGGEAVLDPPAHDARLAKNVPQKAEIVEVDRETEGLGLDGLDPNRQQVSGLGALNVNGTGERVSHPAFQLRECRRGGGGGDLAIQRIEGVQNHLLAGLDRGDRLGVGMPAVVALFRLFAQGARTVHFDSNGHGGPSPGGRKRVDGRAAAIACESERGVSASSGNWPDGGETPPLCRRGAVGGSSARLATSFTKDLLLFAIWNESNGWPSRSSGSLHSNRNTETCAGRDVA